ncbi:MAG: SpoIIE family protein phosphatase [Acidimicrobiales bacterium]
MRPPASRVLDPGGQTSSRWSCCRLRHTVVFATDGVTEARSSVGSRRSHDDDFGIDGLERVVASASTSPRELACAVMSAVKEFRSGPPQDDTAVLVARVT